jgi:hypothetical protein
LAESLACKPQILDVFHAFEEAKADDQYHQ